MTKKLFLFIVFWVGLFISMTQSIGTLYATSDYIIYTNVSDGNKLYRKNANDTGNGTAITSVSLGNESGASYSPDGNYIIYSNADDGYKLYRKNANDTGNGTAITSVNSRLGVYSPDGNYIIYTNISDDYRLYRKNANDTSNGVRINNTQSLFPVYSPDGNNILYVNHFLNNTLYFKSAIDDNDNGYAINSSISYTPVYSPDGNYIIYTNQSNNLLYRKNANDTGNGTTIATNIAYFASYSPDGNYIIYTNSSDGNKLYRKNANDTGNGTPITTDIGYYASYSPGPSGPIDGTCGTNSTYYIYSDTTYAGTFCATGTASPSSPSFPAQGATIAWQCEGTGGGENSPICYASRGNAPVTPVNGTCGTNAQSYSYSDTTYAGTFCATGTASPSSPSFPAQGTNISWNCNGVGGGSTISCTANRTAPPIIVGTCGTNSKTYGSTDTTYAGTFCATGTASPSSPSFPAQDGVSTWQCIGTSGTVPTTCTANRAGEETTDNWFSPISQWFSGLISAIQDASASFEGIFVFGFEWIGFNLENLNFSNFWTIDWNFIGKISPNPDISCEIIQINQTGFGPTYNDIFPNAYNWDGKLYLYNNPLAKYSYGIPTFVLEPVILQEKRFNYVTNSIGSNKLVTMNFMTLDGINVFPFKITLFNIIITDYIDEFILYIEKWILSITSVPMNALASLYNTVYYFGLVFEPDTNYCAYGSVMPLNPNLSSNITTNFNTNQPYVNDITTGLQLITVFIILMFIIPIWKKWNRFLFS